MNAPTDEYPTWVTRMFPAGVPDELAYEVPASDAQMRYLAYLGVRDRWCNREEAGALINRLVKAQKKAARGAAKRGAK